MVEWTGSGRPVAQCMLPSGQLRPARLALGLNRRQAAAILSACHAPATALEWTWWERPARPRLRHGQLLIFITLSYTIRARLAGDTRPTITLLLNGPTQLTEATRGTGLVGSDPVISEIYLLGYLLTCATAIQQQTPFTDNTIAALALINQCRTDIETHIDLVAGEH